MDMNIFQASRGEGQMANFMSVAAPALLPRDELIQRLHGVADTGRLQSGLRALTEYVGASHYLLARCDLIQESGLDFIVSSDWPFDLVKDIANELVSGYARSTELEKCMQVFQPNFGLLPDNAEVPDGASRQYCSLTFNVGRSRLALMFLFG